MKPHILASLALLLIPFCLYSQSGSKPGYIITNTNDTLQGNISYTGARSSVSFYSGEESEGQIFSPDQVKGFGITEGKVYQSTIVLMQGGTQELVFADLLVSGKASLLLYKGTYTLKVKDTTLYLLPEIGGNIREIHQERKKQLHIINYYLSDCSETSGKILKGSPSPSRFSKIVVDYNRCGGASYIEHNNKKPWYKFQYGATAGTSISNIEMSASEGIWLPSSLSRIELNSSVVSPVIGINLITSSPRINDRWALQLDFIVGKSSLQGTRIPRESRADNSNKYYTDLSVKVIYFDIPLTLNHTVVQGSIPMYIKFGGIVSVLQTKDFKTVTETEITTEDGGTTVSTSTGAHPDATHLQFGGIGAIGASKKISNRFQGYLEVSGDVRLADSFRYPHDLTRWSQIKLTFGILRL